MLLKIRKHQNHWCIQYYMLYTIHNGVQKPADLQVLARYTRYYRTSSAMAISRTQIGLRHWDRIIICTFCFVNVLNPIVFSSPEPKAQVSFSDQNLSVVRRCRRCRCCHCRRKLFKFSSSSPEPLGLFQPNLAQSILGWRGFKFVQMKGPALFQGEEDF